MLNQKELFDLIDAYETNDKKIVIRNEIIEKVNFAEGSDTYFECIFQYCIFKECDFSNVEFIRCSFEGCAIYSKEKPMRSTKFRHCNIDEMYLQTCMEDCEFTNCRIAYTNMTTIEDGSYRSRVFLQSCTINHCDFSSMRVSANYDFDRCILEYTNFTNSIVTNLTFIDCKFDNCPGIDPIVPREGSFIGFKRCRDDLIVKLEIPADAKRSSSTCRKCRASKAKVLAIYDINGNETDHNEAISIHLEDFIYEIGKIVIADYFNHNRWATCTGGIHFFLTFEEAANYM